METISSQQTTASLTKEWTVIVEAKDFTMTPVLQLLVNYLVPPLPPQPITQNQEDRGKHYLHHQPLKPCSQIPVVLHDSAGTILSHVICAHVDKEHRVVVSGPDEFWDPLGYVLDTGSREAADLPG